MFSPEQELSVQVGQVDGVHINHVDRLEAGERLKGKIHTTSFNFNFQFQL